MPMKDSEWRHWPVIVGAGVGMGAAIQLYSYTSSLVMPHLVREFGWTRGEISTVTGLAGLGALAQPFIGRWVDRMGGRIVILVCCLLVAASYVGMALMPASLTCFFFLLLLKSVAGPGTSGLPQTRAVASRFQRHRGLALSLTLTILPLISYLFVPQFQKILEGHGWRAGFLTLAGVLAVVGLPVMLLTLRDDKPAKATPHKASPLAQGYDTRTGLRAVPFWLIVAAMVCVNIPGGGILLHMGPLITDHGFSGRDAAQLIAVYPLSMIAGRLVSGAFLDRGGPSVVAAVTTVLPGFGYGIFLLGGVDMTYTTAMVAVALLGVQQGAELDLLSFFMARHVGLKSYGFFYGLASMINAFAISVGTFFFGWAYDLAGSYDAVLLTAAFTFPAGALCFFLLRSFPVFRPVSEVSDAAGEGPSPAAAVTRPAASNG